MNTRIIPLEDQESWKAVVSRSAFYDFYHCNSYNTQEKSGEGFLFVVEDEQNDFIAFPLIKRLIEGTPYFDCTSVYGYAGPISSRTIEQLAPALVQTFQEELLAYLKEQNCVSAFSRLHPIIEQTGYLQNLGKVLSLNKTVAIDLSLPLDEQRKKYRKSTKSEINQLRNRGFSVKQAVTKQEIDEFIAIYTETMQRVSASKYYFFDEEYFRNFLHAEDFSPILLLAYQEEEIAAGAIFTLTNNVMQYHLAGTKEQYIKQTPMKLILDEARILGTNRGQKYLHLGGGVGGSDDDSLFRFKSGFSDMNFVYKVWQLVVNEEVYDQLVKCKAAEKELNGTYFPLYRG